MPLLIYAHQYAELACIATLESQGNLVLSELPWRALRNDVTTIIRSSRASRQAHHAKVATEYDVAYIHHISGTSSDLSKPIPQTHHAAVSVLPCLDGHDFATFTATTLYPDGISGCFPPGRAKL
jgi:hypothetical protein